MAYADEEMPCPRCGKFHKQGPYIARPDLKKTNDARNGVPHAPADINCPCGAKLRQTVPFFVIDRYGWHWRIL